jgi:hypothetical protein
MGNSLTCVFGPTSAQVKTWLCDIGKAMGMNPFVTNALSF